LTALELLLFPESNKRGIIPNLKIGATDQAALTLNPSPRGRGTLPLAPFSRRRRAGDEGSGSVAFAI
jgi:hypothetical protein